MNDRDALALHRLANRLERYEIDNGPMGSNRPFAEEARQLREIADRNHNSNTQSARDARADSDPDWPQR